MSISVAANHRDGWIGLDLTGPIGSTVTITEGDDGAPTPLRTVVLNRSPMRIERVTAWRCDRRTRQIEASTAAPANVIPATLTTTTPSCARRFLVKLRPRTAARVGRRLTISVRDRWRTDGTAARVCLQVRRTSSCRPATIPSVARGVTVRMPVKRAGSARVTISGAGFSARSRLDALGRRQPPRLLAAGDSMIQIIDSLLAARLHPDHRARVVSDARISTGISKPFMFNWVQHARGEAASLRPQATVMFIGANDGFPIGHANCCAKPWIDAYAARVRTMMSAYRRAGAGRVYWLTIPTPRDPARREIYRAVNQAVEQAAAGFTDDEVSVIDLVRIFTPGGVFRSSIHGRIVRQADGIHLNVAGAKIASGVIVKQLRADGLID